MADAPYPAEWETDIVLGDGTTARLRPIKADDRDLLDTFHKRQSQQSVYFRFFRYRPELSDKELNYFTNVDYEQRMAFVATVGDDLVAVARYEQWDSPNHPGERRAEVAFFVDDNHHGRGLATIMLEYLAAAGRRQGFDGFTATVLPENVGMLRVFRKAGFDVSTGFADGVIDVSLGIEVTDATAEAIESRERRAQARSIERLIAPSSVAVVGASRTPGSVGHELVRSIVDGGFEGSVFAVNVAADGNDIAGVPTVASITHLDDAIDLAIVAVPADQVEAVVSECVEIDVGGLLIVTSGFGDLDDEGRIRELELAALTRRHGIRLIGPNAFGLINTDPDHSLHALFEPIRVSPGPVGIVSQSGPLAGGLLHHLHRRRVGVSSMVAVGNRADVSVNDLLQFWHGDDRTSVVAMYLENVGNAAKFSRIARAVSRQKPLVMLAPSDEAMASMLRDAGVVLVGQVAGLVQQVKLFAMQPVPTGSRLAVVTNARSIARLAESAARRAGLTIAEGPHPTAFQVPREADFASYETALVGAAVDADVDLVLVAFVPTPKLPADQLSELVRRVDRAVDKPIALTGLPDPDIIDAPELPIFPFPEGAAAALGRMAVYGRWLRREQGEEPIPEPEVVRAVSDIAVSMLGEADSVTRTLRDPDLPDLLSPLNLPIPAFELARSVDEAVDAAERLGYPLVLKAGGLHSRSPGEKGGAAIDLHESDDVRQALTRMASSIGDALWPVIVQRQSTQGFHLKITVSKSWSQGTFVRLGLGGAVGEHLDHAVSTTMPLSPERLDDVIDASWLQSVLPSGPTRDALIDVVLELATIVDAVPPLVGVTADPVLIAEGSCSIVDLGVRLAPAREHPLESVRHLG